MSKKKTLTIGLSIIAVCLLVVVVYLFVNRTIRRAPTPEETAACAPYAVDWQQETGTESTDLEILLSLCTFSEEKTIGDHTYQIYLSDTLGDHLYRFGEMTEIAMLDGTLYIQYTDDGGSTVTLGYNDTGLVEKAVYRPETDTLYYACGDSVEVWEKFASGIQWGGA